MKDKFNEAQAKWGHSDREGLIWFEGGIDPQNPANQLGQAAEGISITELLVGFSVVICNSDTGFVLGAAVTEDILEKAALERKIDPNDHQITFAPSVFERLEEAGAHFRCAVNMDR